MATEKKACRRGDGAETSSSSSIYCHLHRNPIPSKDNPPPGFCQWLHTFQVSLILFVLSVAVTCFLDHYILLFSNSIGQMLSVYAPLINWLNCASRHKCVTWWPSSNHSSNATLFRCCLKNWLCTCSAFWRLVIWRVLHKPVAAGLS